MNESNEEAYLALVRSWERGGAEEVCAKIRELFTDATVWVQPGLPTTTGPDEAIAIVQTWGGGFASYEVEIRDVASTTPKFSWSASRPSGTPTARSSSRYPSSVWRSSATARSPIGTSTTTARPCQGSARD